MTDSRITVLVVDDSAFMRRVISDMIEKNPEMCVVGTARNGLEALDKARELSPDVITLDVEMPVMDGLTALEKLLRQGDYAVIMVSSHTQRGESATIRALELGAFDFISKPQGIFGVPSDGMGKELDQKDTACVHQQKAGEKCFRHMYKSFSCVRRKCGQIP
jgi:Response regulator receiver domain.